MATQQEMLDLIDSEESAIAAEMGNQGASQEEMLRTIDELAAFDALPANYDNLLPTQAEPEKPYEFSPAAMMFNAPFSAGNLIADMTYPVRHPVQTYQSVKSIAKGLAGKMGMEGLETDEKTIDAIGQMLVDRYGSQENILKTLETDLAGVMADVSAIASGGASIAARLPGKVGSVSKQVGEYAKAVDPINLGVNTIDAGRKVLNRNADPVADVLQAAKFSTVMPLKDRKALAQTMLKNKYGLDMDSAERLMNEMSGMDARIEEMMTSTKGTTRTVSPSSLLKDMPEFAKEWTGRDRSFAVQNAEVIARQYEPWKQERLAEGSIPMTPQELQKYKLEQYRLGKYDKGDSPADDLAAITHRRLGRTAKEQLEQIFPDLATINPQYGDLAELLPNLERSASRVANKSNSGLLPLIRGGLYATAMSSDPIMAGLGGLYGWRQGMKGTDINRMKSAQKTFDQQNMGYSDVYRNNGVVPQMLRGGLLGLGRAEQGLLDRNPDAFSEFAREPLSIKSLLGAWD